MAWITPVFDRTQADVDKKTEKGAWSLTALNRVEGNIQILSGFFNVSLLTKQWAMTEFPSASDYIRILNNVEMLRSLAGLFEDTPATPDRPLNTWQKWNDLEKIIYHLQIQYYQNADSIIYMGELYMGEEIGVM